MAQKRTVEAAQADIGQDQRHVHHSKRILGMTGQENRYKTQTIDKKMMSWTPQDALNRNKTTGRKCNKLKLPPEVQSSQSINHQAKTHLLWIELPRENKKPAQSHWATTPGKTGPKSQK